MASTKAEEGLFNLRATVESTITLITQLQTTVPGKDTTDDPKTNAVHPLDVAHDAASLLKAHSTKLSLLIINRPFTATAITTVLRELLTGPLPGLSAAVQICTAARHSKAMSEELQWRAKNVFVELGTLVKRIPLDGKILGEDAKNGTGMIDGRGSLASTGVVWKACDEIIALKRIGVAGLMVKKAEEYRDLLKDALEELQEWGEEESDVDESEGDDEKDEAHTALDKVFGSQRHIPSEDTEKLRPRLESVQKRLRLVITMYTAVIKRRLKTIPPFPHHDSKDSIGAPGIVDRLDGVLNVMKNIPDITDELASAFYELDGKEIDKRMDQCFQQGFVVAELLLRNWQWQTDEFTTWATKFQAAMKQGW